MQRRHAEQDRGASGCTKQPVEAAPVVALHSSLELCVDVKGHFAVGVSDLAHDPLQRGGVAQTTTHAPMDSALDTQLEIVALVCSDRPP